MKTMIRNKTLRSLCLLLVGLLLVWCSDEAPKWLVQGVGVLLVIPGLASLFTLLRKDRTQRELILYPVMGIVTIIFGLMLILWPSAFVRASMFLLAALLILLGAHQIYSRWRMQKMGIDISGASFLLPLTTIAAGIFILLRRDLAAALLFIVLGAAYILYATMELWSVMSIARFVRQNPQAEPLPGNTMIVAEPEAAYAEAIEDTDGGKETEDPRDNSL